MQWSSTHKANPSLFIHRWQAGMLVMWDNRSVLHAATGGYDGYDRLLHRTTISDTQFNRETSRVWILVWLTSPAPMPTFPIMC